MSRPIARGCMTGRTNWRSIMSGWSPTRRGVTLAFPVNQRPDMPDLALFDITVNPENGWGKGRAYADEWTTLRVSLGNFGERATQADAEWITRTRIDREPEHIEWLNNRGFAPYMTLGVNAVTQLFAFAYFTNAGMHTVYYSTGYGERKGVDGSGTPVSVPIAAVG